MKAPFRKYVIMCVGHTHSGKTTFARKLVEKHPDIVQLDSDEIAAFTKERYPLITNSSYNKNRPNFQNLKMVLFKDVYRFCLRTGNTVILSNGNLAKDIRLFVAREAKKNNYILITIYFNLSQSLILQRLSQTKKNTDVFIQSKSWAEVLERQKKYAKLPPSKRNTIYFEINHDADAEVVMKEIEKII